jgi:enamine deaminase RidA (YjgF/YER057c/UK114 family)
METQQPNVRFINRAPAGYSHVVEVKGGRTLYIAGQIAVDKNGNLAGRGDFRAQVKQVFENLKARLEEAGASFKDVVKLNYYLTDASDLQSLRETRNSYINSVIGSGGLLCPVTRRRAMRSSAWFETPNTETCAKSLPRSSTLHQRKTRTPDQVDWC